MDRKNSKGRIGVLALDGGGVRGLSSLLILRALMGAINETIRSRIGYSTKPVEAHDVFQLITGTSTGGLIALMLGKMNMTVDQCIAQYFDLAKDVFGKRSVRGKFTKGLGKPRYYAHRLQTCVENLLRRHDLDAEMHMQDGPRSTATACAVVCTEHETSSRTDPVFKNVVCICSLPCPETIRCTVCEAAQATSAAATYFPFISIGEKTLSDGGFKHNNPSWAVVSHYTEYTRITASGSAALRDPNTPAFAQHGDGELDWSTLRFVNIGTGTRQNDEEVPQQGKFLTRYLVPGAFRLARALSRNVVRAVVDSEEKASNMRILEKLSKGDVRYHRLSATHQVYSFKLDDYKHLEDIERRTGEYLAETKTQADIQAIADKISRDYLKKQGLTPENIPRDDATQATDTGDLEPGPSKADHEGHLPPKLQLKTSDITGISNTESQSRRSENTVSTSMDHSAEAESSDHPKNAISQLEFHTNKTSISANLDKMPRTS